MRREDYSRDRRRNRDKFELIFKEEKYSNLINSTKLTKLTKLTKSALSENEICPICREFYLPNDSIHQLSCKHFAHLDCLKEWCVTVGKKECVYHCKLDTIAD